MKLNDLFESKQPIKESILDQPYEVGAEPRSDAVYIDLRNFKSIELPLNLRKDLWNAIRLLTDKFASQEDNNKELFKDLFMMLEYHGTEAKGSYSRVYPELDAKVKNITETYYNLLKSLAIEESMKIKDSYKALFTALNNAKSLEELQAIVNKNKIEK